MKAGALVAAAALTVVVLSATAARAADECRGLMVCIPVAGPWVVLPAPSAADRYPERSWLMRCPRGSIVGGVDARLTDRTLDMSFPGRLGSPVNPGVTTTSEVVFTGVRTGRSRNPAAFRPFVGCIPTAGGGRIPTAVKPGRPTTFRTRTAPVPSGSTVTLSASCGRGERLVSWTHAVAFRRAKEPTVAELRAVRTTVVEKNGVVAARASVGVTARDARARLQVLALCTRGPGLP